MWSPLPIQSRSRRVQGIAPAIFEQAVAVAVRGDFGVAVELAAEKLERCRRRGDAMVAHPGDVVLFLGMNRLRAWRPARVRRQSAPAPARASGPSSAVRRRCRAGRGCWHWRGDRKRERPASPGPPARARGGCRSGLPSRPGARAQTRPGRHDARRSCARPRPPPPGSG